MSTPIRVDAAKAALNQYLDLAGITEPRARFDAMNRLIALTLLQMLQRSHLATDLDVFDISAGRDALIGELIWQMPYTLDLTEVQP